MSAAILALIAIAVIAATPEPLAKVILAASLLLTLVGGIAGAVAQLLGWID
jgi:heme O synthase-like polyprenyltransferase